MTYDALISYSAREAPRAERLVSALHEAKLSVWFDKLKRQVEGMGPHESLLPPGSDHWKAIARAIDSSAVLLVLDSPLWRASEYCQQELAHALARGKRVVALGSPESETPFAAVRLGAEDFPGAIAAVHEGLRVSSAHARLTVATHSSSGGRRSLATIGSAGDATLLARADSRGIGIVLTPEMSECVTRTLRRSQRRRRTLMAMSSGVLAVVAVLAAVAIFASRSAQESSDRAKAAARHVQALSEATVSEGVNNTLVRLTTAERAVSLEQNSITVGALGDALASLSEGVTVTGLPQVPPTGVAIANDGRLAAELLPRGGLTLVDVAERSAPRLLAQTIEGGGAPVFSPDGTRVAFTRRDNGAAEIIDVLSGQATAVPGTSNLVGVMFVSSARAVAVARNGAVLEFDPRSPGRAASRLGAVRGAVRAAAIANVSSSGRLELATLDDDMDVVVSSPQADAGEWRVHLDVKPGPYILGWESIHVCGGELSILTTDLADMGGPAFAIPYTVTAQGRATATGSLIHSFGLVCLPQGGALASDPLDGEESFPADGISLVGFTRPVSERVEYAVASSENDRWAVAAGNDGTLRIADLRSTGRSTKFSGVKIVASGNPAIAVSQRGELEWVSTTASPSKLTSAMPADDPVRGTYIDSRLGTVMALGRELMVVDGTHVLRHLRLPDEIETIRPGEPGHSALVLLADGHVMLAALSGQQKPKNVAIPGNLDRAGDEISDVSMVSSDRLALASSNGRVDLVDLAHGREIEGRVVSPPGDEVLWSDDGKIVLGDNDGTIEILDASDLAIRASRKVLAEPILDLEGNASGSQIAVQSSGSHIVVLAMPQLFTLAHIGGIQDLGPVTFARTDQDLLVSSNTSFMGGADEALLISWPLCTLCSGSAAALRAAAAALTAPSRGGHGSQFIPATKR